MFRYYNKVDYKIDEYHSLSAIDITTRTKINDYIFRAGGAGARDYLIQEGERPEGIANRLYGRPSYAYILLLSNNIHNLYDEWPKDSETFKKYIIEKYGSITAARSQVRFYYTGDGFITSQSTYESLIDGGKYNETDYEYESRLNEEKRSIKILQPNLVKRIEVAIQESLYSTENF